MAGGSLTIAGRAAVRAVRRAYRSTPRRTTTTLVSPITHKSPPLALDGIEMKKLLDLEEVKRKAELKGLLDGVTKNWEKKLEKAMKTITLPTPIIHEISPLALERVEMKKLLDLEEVKRKDELKVLLDGVTNNWEKKLEKAMKMLESKGVVSGEKVKTRDVQSEKAMQAYGEKAEEKVVRPVEVVKETQAGEEKREELVSHGSEGKSAGIDLAVVEDTMQPKKGDALPDQVMVDVDTLEKMVRLVLSHLHTICVG
jgi:hypothetical protein